MSASMPGQYTVDSVTSCNFWCLGDFNVDLRGFCDVLLFLSVAVHLLWKACLSHTPKSVRKLVAPCVGGVLFMISHSIAPVIDVKSV